MRDKERYALRVLAIAAAVTFTMSGGLAWAQPQVVFPPDSNPFGKPIQNWTAEWWQLMLSIPAADNPIVDHTGRNCAVGQRGPVWFLAGSPGTVETRACSIPDGKALFFPIINLADINTTNQTAKELRAELAPCMDRITTLSVEVDGKPLRNLNDSARVRSAVFEITVPHDGFLDPGTYSPVVDDGFYVMLKPLSVGNHNLHLRGATDGCPLQGPFSVDVLYHLTVVPISLK